MARKDSFGKWGEEYAARFLADLGYELIERNWRSPACEVDLVLREAGVYVICEVKTRRDSSRGHPSEAVNARRLHRLTAAAELWLRDHPAATVRIDVVSVLATAAGIRVEVAKAVTV